MRKLFSVSTLAIISSLILTGCGNVTKEPIKTEKNNNSVESKAEETVNNKNPESEEPETVSKTSDEYHIIKHLDNVTMIIDTVETTNDEKIKDLKNELEALNKIDINSITNKTTKEALENLIEGTSKQIKFLEGVEEVNKGNKSDSYKEELVAIAYEATDCILAASIVLK